MQPQQSGDGGRTFLTSVPSGGDSGRMPNKFPPLQQQPQVQGRSTLPVGPNQKVDLRDLTWEDKERVLRLLFARINQAQLPPPIVMPPHSFDVPK